MQSNRTIKKDGKKDSKNPSSEQESAKKDGSLMGKDKDASLMLKNK
jgi:hypothetical protein